MKGRFVLDTNILIDFFRRRPDAVAFVKALGLRPIVPPIVVSELYASVRDGTERQDVESFLTRCVVVDLDELIAMNEGLILRQYRKSHGVGLADAIVAATGEVEAATVVTLNTKHFPSVRSSVLLKPY